MVNNGLTFIQRPGNQVHNCKTVYCLRIYRRKKIITLEKLSPEKKIVTQQGPNGTTKEAPGPGKGYDQQ